LAMPELSNGWISRKLNLNMDIDKT
jgi:hypothetical protein